MYAFIKAVTVFKVCTFMGFPSLRFDDSSLINSLWYFPKKVDTISFRSFEWKFPQSLLFLVVIIADMKVQLSDYEVLTAHKICAFMDLLFLRRSLFSVMGFY